MIVVPQNLLILETSHSPGFVAVAEGPRVVACRSLDEARRHARDLAPAVADLLAKVGWQPKDVTAVAISRGPGSYTGLRVGIMSAKAFAYAIPCAVVAIDTFAAIASQAPGYVSRLAVLADAQQDKLYVQEFTRDGEDWVAIGPLAIRPFMDWLSGISVPLGVSGPGLEKWDSHLPANIQQVAAPLWTPLPQTLAHMANARLLRGETDDLWSLEPIYLRPSAAEEQWQKRPH
jgi:tRNA threonylcarbamoyladenosine biosynthesis protein TsaB